MKGSRLPRLVALLLGCGLSALLLALLETAGSVWLAARAGAGPEIRRQGVEIALEDDPVLGYRPVPGSRARVRLVVDGEPVWAVEYRFDRYGRRTTAVTDPGRRRRPVLFLGCSYVFGSGLRDFETLPARLAERFPSILPINLAFNGYGAQQMLAALESGRGLPHAGPGIGAGAALYLFIDDHVPRTIGTMRQAARVSPLVPLYAVDDAGVVHRRGSFGTGRPWTSRAYALFSRSALLRAFSADLPLRFPRPRHLETVARIIAASRDRYLERFPGGAFLAVLYPGSELPLAGPLRRLGVAVLDLRGLFDPQDPRFRHHRHDPHPNARAASAMAEALSPPLERSLEATGGF